jgi:hypothetical protein
MLSVADWKVVRIYLFNRGISFQCYVEELIRKDLQCNKEKIVCF